MTLGGELKKARLAAGVVPRVVGEQVEEVAGVVFEDAGVIGSVARLIEA